MIANAPSRRRVLYVQHAAFGGSAMSLYYTVTALDRTRWDPVVAFTRSSPEALDLFQAAGIECFEWPGIITLEHTTAKHLRWWSPLDWVTALEMASSVPGSVRRTRQLVDEAKPDVVHLNSVVLSAAAVALRNADVPWIWHVRESPVRGALGARTKVLGDALVNWPDEAIFISEADRQAWVGDRGGLVVYNFVDLQRFRPDLSDRRPELGISADAPVIVYLGGIAAIKGIIPLLEALRLLRPRWPGLRCIMPGTVYEQSRSLAARTARAVLPLIASGTLSQRAKRAMEDLGDTCVLLPFETDIAPIIAAGDVVVFPAVRPHFPRPAMEAAAMGKPVVASRLAGVSEVVEDGKTGILTRPGDPADLASALDTLIQDPDLRREFGRNGRERAQALFDRSTQCRRITDIYERLCAT